MYKILQFSTETKQKKKNETKTNPKAIKNPNLIGMLSTQIKKKQHQYQHCHQVQREIRTTQY
jgi:hypothetical protein